MNKNIHVQYFALLREERGLSQEAIATRCENARELYLELKQKFGFRLDAKFLRVAINNEFKSWDTPLNNNDRVAFIPPVAGG